MLVPEIAFALALMQAPLSQRSVQGAETERALVRAIGGLLRAEQLVLRGPRDRRELLLPVQRAARARPGRIDLGFDFEGVMLPDANVQLFVNGHRRTVVARSGAGPDGRARVVLPLAASDLAGGSVALGIEARLVSGSDRCAEEARSSARVRIDPASTLVLHPVGEAVGSREAAVEALPQQVVFSLANRAITASELDTVLLAASRLAQVGHSVRFVRTPGQAIVAVAHGGVVPADVLRSVEVEPAPRAINPTLPELGVGDLSRDAARAAQWRIPLDMRTLPPGRVPERIILKMVVAPDQLDDLLDMRVYLNDLLLRRVNVLGNGTRRTIRFTLPLSELRIYNEVRVIAERSQETFSSCTHEPMTYPSQVQEDSYLVTAAAPAKPRGFGAFVAALPARFDLFVPEATARDVETLLPLLLAAERSLWGPGRRARVRLYSAGERPSPDDAAVVVQPSGGGETVVQLVRLNGHSVLSITPALHNPRLPDVPDEYGNADSVAFGASGIRSGRATVASQSDTGPVDAVRFALAYRLWVVLATLLLITGGFVVYSRLRRRSPR